MGFLSVKMGKIGLVCLLAMGALPQLYAQIEMQLGDSSVSFEEAIVSLEKDYPFQFFYQPEWVQTLRVKGIGKWSSLEAWLEEVLVNSDLHYYQVSPGRVVLTRGAPIVAQFPPRQGAFESPASDSVGTPTLFEIQPVSEPQPAPLGGIENTVIEVGVRGNKSVATVGGYIRHAATGEALVGATVVVQNPPRGTLTDAYGYYVLSLPPGEHELLVSYVGRKDTRRKIRLLGDGNLDVDMEEEILSLNEVVISGEKSQVESVQTGVARLNLSEIESIPTLFGEADIMKISLTLPGVQTAGEGSSGIYVRGGGADQNLILLDDAPIYNPSHLFGFFSVFNSSVIKHAELYKSGIQAHYGGRVSSVMDVSIRDGNRKKFIASAGISPVTGKVSVEGPIPGDRGSFILGLRSTYANWLLRALDNPSLNNSRAFFADVIGKVNYQLNENNLITLSGYHSQDRFQLDQDTVYSYANSSLSLRWRHVFNNQFSGLFSAGFTNYGFQLESERRESRSFLMDYEISQLQLKADFDFYPNSTHHLRFGWQSVGYDLSPGQQVPLGEASVIQGVDLGSERGLEHAIHIGDEMTLSPRFSIYAGVRVSLFQALGPGKVYQYQPNLPKEAIFITDSVEVGAGKVAQTYWGPEFRFSSRYKLGKSLSLKFSYDNTRQYIHMLTNTLAISPTDTWRLSSTHIKPLIGNQWALGLYKEFSAQGLEISLEGYFKTVDNQLEYKDGAELLLNEIIETDVVGAFAKSFGVEFLLKKKTGQLTGWLSYTYSRALVRADSPFASERINGGQFYPANFDQPHNLSLITNYKFNRRINFSFNIKYNTGRPATLPIGQYQLAGNTYAFFSGRNRFRIPDYFRTDFSLTIEGNHKVDKPGHSSWGFSVYNLTGRRNAYSVFSRVNNGEIGTFKLSIFGRPIFTITYNFELR